MKIVLLDGEKLRGMEDVHQAFAEALEFPPETGKNLDALYDKLTETKAEIGVITVNAKELKSVLGRRWKGFMRLMSDLQRERDGFYFSIPFGEE